MGAYTPYQKEWMWYTVGAEKTGRVVHEAAIASGSAAATHWSWTSLERRIAVYGKWTRLLGPGL